jgi:hypothetical protein
MLIHENGGHTMNEELFRSLMIWCGMILWLNGALINNFSHLVRDRNIMFGMKPPYLFVFSNRDKIMYATYFLQMTGYLFIIIGTLFYLVDRYGLFMFLHEPIEMIQILVTFLSLFVFTIVAVFIAIYRYK